ncbi:MAG: MarR family winged helix-turn-helix transcriptional regulator [Solirubrobacteraceae bacterium]
MLASKQVSPFTEPEAAIPSPTPSASTAAATPLADGATGPGADPAARLRIAIGRLSRRLHRTAAGAAAGLTPTRISVLLTIVRKGPIRLSALAEFESLHPTMLSRVIADLVDAGLVARTCDEGDRRAAWVQATAAGEQLADRMRRERTDALHAALDALSEAERQRLQSALPALEALADELRTVRA